MTEPRPNDETRRRFEEILEAKKAVQKTSSSTDGPVQGRGGRAAPAKGSRGYKRRKV